MGVSSCSVCQYSVVDTGLLSNPCACLRYDRPFERVMRMAVSTPSRYSGDRRDGRQVRVPDVAGHTGRRLIQVRRYGVAGAPVASRNMKER